jgi:tetratricopeptide (TPR) repeat protein
MEHSETIGILSPGNMVSMVAVDTSGRSTHAGPALLPAIDLAQTLPVGTAAPLKQTIATRPARLGRFTILDQLGIGAMGVVYAAYDETLDRKVAVKVLHDADDAAQIRLVREAQAMARVSHPNVVTVLEAGVAGGRVYVAMEFIRGVTLGAWLSETPRAWPEIVDVFVQAGRGLAAAHAAGLVHRDFKPSNVMIDETGRARVLDFGLVRATASAVTADPSMSASHLHLHLTHDSQIIGTPAYMSPEQWRGEPSEPVSDQFSFCVALYTALYGQPPFHGDTLVRLSQAVKGGQLRDAPRKLGTPAWLAAVVTRGLRPDPKDRYPSMPALLAALERRRSRGGTTTLAAAVLAGAAAVAGFAFARESAAVPCTGAAEDILRSWGPGPRESVAGALRRAAPDYAAVLWPRVADTLDRYAASWTELRTDACLAHHRGDRSAALFDRQMRCLDRRRAALDETVRALAAAEPDVAPRALDVAGTLPALHACANLEALAAESPPPDDPAVAARVDVIRGEMNRADVLARLGRLSDAVALATDLVAAAESTDYGPLRAEALLLRGRLALNLADGAVDKLGWLTRAIGAGFAAHSDPVAAEALALRIYALARQPDLADRALADEPLALALADRTANPDAHRGLVLNNIGTVHLARRQPAEARRYFTEALAMREQALGPHHREVGYTQLNLALATDPGPGRERLIVRALEILELELGPAHPEMIEARIASANLVGPGGGQALLRPACAALASFLADDAARRVDCLFHLGRMSTEVGDDDEARASFLAAGELRERPSTTPPDPKSLATVMLTGYIAAAESTPDAAIGPLLMALEHIPDAWWARAESAELRLVLGQNLLLAGRLDEARAALEASLTDYVALAQDDPLFQPPLARARRTLAEVLVAQGPETAAAARSHLAGAAEFYRGAGPNFSRQLQRTEQLTARATATPVPSP